MEWFYHLDGQPTGPISAKNLKALFQGKTITAKTPVRREDMTEWRPLGHFVKGRSQQTPAAESPESEPLKMANPDLKEESKRIPAPPAAQPASRCSQCGRAFPADDLIKFDDALICAACKPLFTQKLREGVRVQSALAYAGFWIRFGAKFIDWIVVTVASMIVGFAIGLLFGGVGESGGFTATNLLIQALNIAIPAIYATYLLGKYGATLGKMACGIKVVRPDGGAISYPRALGRHFAEILSSVILMIGYIMVAFDSEKRSLHDRICSTRVVRT